MSFQSIFFIYLTRQYGKYYKKKKRLDNNFRSGSVFFSIIIQYINTLNNVVFMTCPSNLYANIFLLQSRKAILKNEKRYWKISHYKQRCWKFWNTAIGKYKLSLKSFYPVFTGWWLKPYNNKFFEPITAIIYGNVHKSMLFRIKCLKNINVVLRKKSIYRIVLSSYSYNILYSLKCIK